MRSEEETLVDSLGQGSDEMSKSKEKVLDSALSHGNTDREDTKQIEKRIETADYGNGDSARNDPDFKEIKASVETQMLDVNLEMFTDNQKYQISMADGQDSLVKQSMKSLDSI